MSQPLAAVPIISLLIPQRPLVSLPYIGRVPKMFKYLLYIKYKVRCQSVE